MDTSSKTHLVNAMLKLSPPGGGAFEVLVLAIDLNEDGQRRLLEMNLELSPELWRRTEQEHLFHLTPESRGPMQGRFDETRPVTLRILLNPVFLDGVPGEPGEAWKVMRAGSDPHLLATESWFLRAAKQASPPGGGKFGPRFTTAWFQFFEERRRETPAVLLPVVLSVFQGRDWPHEINESEGIVEMSFEGEHGQWRFVAMVREKLGQVICYSILEEAVSPPRMDEAMRLATIVNNGLAVGSFELDLSSGEWAFRTSIDVEGDRLSEALFESLADANLAQFDRHFAAISALNDGATVEAALALVG